MGFGLVASNHFIKYMMDDAMSKVTSLTQIHVGINPMERPRLTN